MGCSGTATDQHACRSIGRSSTAHHGGFPQQVENSVTADQMSEAIREYCSSYLKGADTGDAAPPLGGGGGMSGREVESLLDDRLRGRAMCVPTMVPTSCSLPVHGEFVDLAHRRWTHLIRAPQLSSLGMPSGPASSVRLTPLCTMWWWWWCGGGAAGAGCRSGRWRACWTSGTSECR